jgi:leucyl/phenylalanyl-tRNA---protein transferase
MSRRKILPISPHLLLRAYSIGLFPMAESAEDDELFWVDPDPRALFPLESFKPTRSLAKVIKSDRFDIRIDTDFQAVMAACAAPAPGREKTWINRDILRLYCELHEMGYAHSVECWRNGALIGGLYGVKLRGAFFGESMFHHERDASKVALAHLIARLKKGGFDLLDTQFITPHLTSLGAVEIPREAYLVKLETALTRQANFHIWPKDYVVSGSEALAALALDDM